jgi:hypothetical protein
MLGVASTLVAVAALTIVFAGTGSAQNGNGGPNVVITNTPLPVTGNISATIPGNVSATIVNIPLPVGGNVNAAVTGDVTVNNPSDNPVLIRDVDAQGAKQLVQIKKSITMADGVSFGSIDFDPVPAGKALVVKHLNVFFQTQADFSKGVYAFVMTNSTAFTGFGPSDGQYFVPQQIGYGFIANEATTFYAAAEKVLRVSMLRFDSAGQASATATVTGYLVDHP